MRIYIALIALLLPTLAVAQAMQVDADRFELVQEQQLAVFMGHVVAVRGAMEIRSDKITLWYAQNEEGKNSVKSAKAEGNVYLKTAENQGQADVVTFDVGSEVVVLKGNASMKSEQGVIKGEHIEYHITSQDTRVLKGDSEQQVHFIFGEGNK